MHLSLSVNLHDRIGRLASLLSRIGQTSRVHGNDVIINIDHRPMGMSVQHDINAPVNGLFFDGLISHGYIIIVSVGHPYFVGSDIQCDLSGEIREKVIVAQDDINRAFCRRRKCILTALRISAVDHHVRVVHLQYFEVILILFMGITYDQYLHISSVPLSSAPMPYLCD